MAELQISPQMSLEQAMAEVRTYLEAKKRPASATREFGAGAEGQLFMQENFIHRMGDLANQLGQVEPNSKLGAPGVFLKRVVRKLIGWYSRPAQQFDRTAYEAFVQIRQDMLRQHQQIAALESKIAGDERQQELVDGMKAVFQALITIPSVRQGLAAEHPELLEKVEALLDGFSDQSGKQSAVRSGNART